MTTMHAPIDTPWGQPQSVEHIADGIVFVSTASHGGFVLSESRNSQIPRYMKCCSTVGAQMRRGFYEEDCAQAIVIVVFSHFFGTDLVAAAHTAMKHWYPDAYEQFTGQTVDASESLVRREEEFDAANQDNLVVISALGYGPLVLGIAVKGRDRKNRGLRAPTPCEYAFAIATERYERRGSNPYVIDPYYDQALPYVSDHGPELPSGWYHGTIAIGPYDTGVVYRDEQKLGSLPLTDDLLLAACRGTQVTIHYTSHATEVISA
jgi:hypothetical protein